MSVSANFFVLLTSCQEYNLVVRNGGGCGKRSFSDAVAYAKTKKGFGGEDFEFFDDRPCLQLEGG